jgi:hypothetical protein
MASEEADRRIEEAAAEAARQKQAKEFLEGLTKDDQLVRPTYTRLGSQSLSAARSGPTSRLRAESPRQITTKNPNYWRRDAEREAMQSSRERRARKSLRR